MKSPSFAIDSETEAGPGRILILRDDAERQGAWHFIAWAPADGSSIATIARTMPRWIANDASRFAETSRLSNILRRLARNQGAHIVAEMHADELFARIKALPEHRNPFRPHEPDVADQTEHEATQRRELVDALAAALSQGYFVDGEAEPYDLREKRDALGIARHLERAIEGLSFDESHLDILKKIGAEFPAALDRAEADPVCWARAASVLEAAHRKSAASTAPAILDIRAQADSLLGAQTPAP